MGGFKGARCAGWAWNPKGPQVTLFCHQMGRHPTIWDFKTGIRHRIPARISPWGSRGLNPNFFSFILEPKNAKIQISARFSKLLAPIASDLGPQGAQGPPKGPLGAPKGPRGPHGPLGRPSKWRPLGPLGGSENGTPWARWAPGAQNPMRWVPIISKTCQKLAFLKAYRPHKFENLPEICILAFFGSQMGRKMLGFRPRDPHSEIRAGLLCRIPVLKSQMVEWRPIW